MRTSNKYQSAYAAALLDKGQNDGSDVQKRQYSNKRRDERNPQAGLSVFILKRLAVQ